MITIIDILAHHNHWATKQLIDTCRDLDEPQLHERFEIGVGSLHDTILHIIGAMQAWADRMGGRDRRPSLRGDGTKYSLDQLDSVLEEASHDLHDVVSTIRRNKRIHEKITCTFEGYGTYTFSLGSAIVHVYTHGSYHFAQAMNMLRRLGVTGLPDLSAIDAELEGDLETFAS